MTAVVLTREIEEWAQAEVQAGKAETVEALALGVLDRERQLVAFRATLDAAEADEEGRRPADEFFADLKARYSGGL